MSRARLALIVGIALLLSTAAADAAVVSPPTVTIKAFTGLLSDAGPATHNPGDRLKPFPQARYINFICDPRGVPWNIRIANFTIYNNDPHICDHVLIVMFYYDPPRNFPGIPDPVDGTAIFIQKIP